MATQTKTFNLTPLFILWTAFFVVVYALTDGTGWLWVAALPWLFMGLFMGGILLILVVIYVAGGPVTVTRGTVKTVYQRGRKPRRLYS